MTRFQTAVLERDRAKPTCTTTMTTTTSFPKPMPDVPAAELDLILLEDTVWLLVGDVNSPSDDFSIANFLACRHPWQCTEPITAIARGGAISNYDQLYQELTENGIQLVHSPAQYRLASELPQWYPLLDGLTPKSVWFTEPPTFEALAEQLGVPFLMQRSRQTRRHQAALSLIHNRAEYDAAITQTDPIQPWQDLVFQEFVPLRAIPTEPTENMPPSFEFRTFWWRGRCIGAGQSWSTDYDWTDAEQMGALAIAQAAATRLDLPFVAIDVAQTATGDWIVIECNDAQECDYGAVSPFSLWQNLVFEEQQVCQVG